MSDFRGRRLWACGPGVGRCTRYSIGSVVVVRRWRDGSGNETRGFVDAPTIRIIVMVRRNSAPVPSLSQAATPRPARCLVCRSAALSFCSFFVFFPPLQSRTFGVGCVRGGACGEPAHRGKIRSHTTGCGVCVRVIPALAGAPDSDCGAFGGSVVHSRVGGEHASSPDVSFLLYGSSPLAREHPCRLCPLVRSAGSSPVRGPNHFRFDPQALVVGSPPCAGIMPTPRVDDPPRIDVGAIATSPNGTTRTRRHLRPRHAHTCTPDANAKRGRSRAFVLQRHGRTDRGPGLPGLAAAPVLMTLARSVAHARIPDTASADACSPHPRDHPARPPPCSSALHPPRRFKRSDGPTAPESSTRNRPQSSSRSRRAS